MAQGIPPTVLHGVQKLKREIIASREQRRKSFMEAVRLTNFVEKHKHPSPQDLLALDVAIERFFVCAKHAHELTEKFSNLGIMLEFSESELDRQSR